MNTPNPTPAADMAVEAIEREKFEAWAKSEWADRSVPDNAWLGWKARAALARPQEVAGVTEAMVLLGRAERQLERWAEKYAQHNPEWLTPAGDVKLLEDIEQFLTTTGNPTPDSCPDCGDEHPHFHALSSGVLKKTTMPEVSRIWTEQGLVVMRWPTPQIVKDFVRKATAEQETKAAPDAHPLSNMRGFMVLRGAIEMLREEAVYRDDEGEDTDALEELHAAISASRAPVAVGVEPSGLRDVVAQVCEGWTLPEGARKMLETALWATPAPSVPLGGGEVSLRAALQELHDRCVEVKAALDTDIPDGEPVHPLSSRLTWPLSTASMALSAHPLQAQDAATVGPKCQSGG